jgi:hypothetical protein
MVSQEIASEESDKTVAEPALPMELERKLVKTGDVSFESGEMAADRLRVEQSVKELGGYVSGESENFYGARHEVRYSLRVPSDKFDQLVARVTEGAKKVDHKNIVVSDVTMEYYDLEGRLKTQKEIRDRYAELLAKAKSVSEVLDVERELGKIQVEIESMEGRMKVLKSQVALGTLELTLWEGRDVEQGWSGRFGSALENGWNGFVWFLVIVVGLWPFWLMCLGIYFFVRYLIRRSQNRKQA